MAINQKALQTVIKMSEDQIAGRTLLCETHNRQCSINDLAGRCPCCGKRLCLCNYVL